MTAECCGRTKIVYEIIIILLSGLCVVRHSLQIAMKLTHSRNGHLCYCINFYITVNYEHEYNIRTIELKVIFGCKGYQIRSEFKKNI